MLDQLFSLQNTSHAQELVVKTFKHSDPVWGMKSRLQRV